MPSRCSLLALLLPLVACSSAASPSTGAPDAGGHEDRESPHEASASDRAVPADAAHRDVEGADAPRESANDSPSASDATIAGSGPCASCTASKCLMQLEACAGSSVCTDALVAFNSCFTAPALGASCGASFAMQGSEAAALWACLSTMCASTCD